MTAFALAIALSTQLVLHDAQQVKLIAHRGGVVDKTHIENNLPGIEEAVRRGYWMLEVDIRESKDGHLVVHHDADFRRFYGDDRRVADMTWDEIKSLRSTPGDLRPLEFAEYAAACDGKIRLMLDTKGPQHSDAFFAELVGVLRDHDLLANAYVIGTEQSRALLLDKAKIGINHQQLKAAIDAGEDVASRYFLFEHGRGMEAGTVEFCRRHGVDVVPSINTFHYLTGSHREQAAADIARLREMGVTQFQIDSVYEAFCTEQ